MSIANLFHPNDYDLYCDTLTCNNLDYQGSLTSGTLAMTGALVGNVTYNISRVGKTVTVRLNATVGTTVANLPITLTAIPTAFWPQFDFSAPSISYVNGNHQAGAISMSATGIINVYATAALAAYPTATMNSGFNDDIYFTYLIA